MRRTALTVAMLVAAPRLAAAFPPYRSTDAGTADPWVLEPRIGARVAREGEDDSVTVPSLRLNLGLPFHLEIPSELEFDAEEGKVADAAIGIKWVPIGERATAGIEVLALLPVEGSGAGVSAALLGTLRADRMRFHLNLGGVRDARPEVTEDLVTASGLAELTLGRFRPGVELATVRLLGDAAETRATAGAGVIVALGPIDVRTGVHAGLTEAAADVAASLWITTAIPVR
jgi:hypothetical protein